MEEVKRAAAREAVEHYVESGMVLGLGSGTTSMWVVRRVGELISGGELGRVRGIPTSETTAALAREVGIPLISLSEGRPDLTLDGADEVSPGLDAVKGLGGALLREKIVASASRDGLVIVADGSKMVDALGGLQLPVEMEPFGYEATLESLAALGCEPELRMVKEKPFVTDGGHYTADCRFPGIPEPATLETEIKRIPGALECGLFTGMVGAAVIADSGEEDGVRIIEQ